MYQGAFAPCHQMRNWFVQANTARISRDHEHEEGLTLYLGGLKTKAGVAAACRVLYFMPFLFCPCTSILVIPSESCGRRSEWQCSTFRSDSESCPLKISSCFLFLLLNNAAH